MINKNHSGFSLLEVLFAMLIFSFGILGLAGMQSLIIKNNMIAEHRSQASLIAYDLIDRMRANRSSLINYQSTFNNPPFTPSQAVCLSTLGCTPFQMTQNDIFEWNQIIINSLPRGVGRVTLNAATATYTITINWDVNQDGSTDNFDNIFTTSFQL